MLQGFKGGRKCEGKVAKRGRQPFETPEAHAFATDAREACHLLPPPSACTSMALPRYTEACRLSDRLGHYKGVTALSFSADGSYLASAGLDNRICIWDPHAQKLLHSVEVSVAIYSLDWAQNDEDLLVCGLGDGTLVSIVITPVRATM